MNKKKTLLILREWLLITVGTAVIACAYVMFFIPNKIVPGGVSGISTVIFYVSGFPVGAAILLINIPVFILGFKNIGLTYIIRSAFSTVLLSVLIDVLPLPSPTDNLLLSVLIGGAMSGTGMGIVFMSFASTGGADIIAKIVNKYRPHLSLGRLIFIMDAVIILASSFIVGIEPALFALIGVFISQKATDYVLDGFRSARAYYVVSDKYAQIAEEVMSKINRGATLINARGMYSGREQSMLLCIIKPQEIGAFLHILHNTDPNAFVFVTNIHEVMGEGFGREDNIRYRRRLDENRIISDNKEKIGRI